MADDVKGIQLAGFVNLAMKDVKGGQAAGFVNVAKSFEVAQVAGFVNLAKKVKGLQLCFLNFADSIESVMAIGFLSFALKGYYALDVSYNETFIANLQFKLVHELFYNIIGLLYLRGATLQCDLVMV